MTFSIAWLAMLAAGENERFAPILAPDAEITLQAHWSSCQWSTYGLFRETGVLQVPCLNEERQRYGHDELQALLPPGPVELGETWRVPTQAVLTFLRQFDASATDQLHHGHGKVPGAFACVRAVSDEYLEILLRAHAEFVLEGGVTYTPAQFEGRLVLARASGRVVAFRLALPANGPNVDVNVPTEHTPVPNGPVERIQMADIGFVPRMELVGGALEELESPEGLSLAEARHELARAFYPHERLTWLSLPEALRVSRDEQRPLHVILLFGALDDESC